MPGLEWPYSLEYGQEEILDADVLILGGGVAGCMAAISAARNGQKVILIEKGATKRSGAAGSGVDHWENAPTNPCSKITPEELTQALLDEHEGFYNGISHYIECREGYDRILDLERMGGKVRDTEDEFKGAEFRDEKTKLLFAYDYENKYTLRVWGSTFKPAMYNELRRLGVRILDRIMVTSLLTENGEMGNRCIGATGVHTRTGKFYIFRGKACVICLSRPARIWLFSASLPGLCEFRPTQSVGDGHAIGWRAGAEFTMMEASVPAEFSAAGRSYPPYGTGNNQNTWYAATLIDSNGKEIPYIDRDGKVLKEVSERYRPASGQKFFLKGAQLGSNKYAYAGPETPSFSQLLEQGYEFPFYADLSRMPELERKVIWGMMVGEEGKTKVPVYKNYREAGFDPEKHVLQCYGEGWTSGQFLPQERYFFGGGFVNDWTLKTNIEGLFVAGDSLFAGNCFGHAAATGYYAGRHAAKYAMAHSLGEVHPSQVEQEKRRIYSPLRNDPKKSYGWKELNMAISKTMRIYCGDVKWERMLKIGLEQLKEYEEKIVPQTFAYNPHELIRLLEVFNILTISQMIMHACLARKKSATPLCFIRGDTKEKDPQEERKFITLKQSNSEIKIGELSLDYYGDLEKNYEYFNVEYIKGRIK